MKSCLLVDDSKAIRAIVRPILVNLGFEVIEAGDGGAAVAAFADHAETIDLVLLDLEMPVMGGAEAIPHLRARRPSVRILVMSGHSVTDVDGAALDAFLHKPFTITALRERVFAVLHEAAKPPA